MRTDLLLNYYEKNKFLQKLSPSVMMRKGVIFAENMLK